MKEQIVRSVFWIVWSRGGVQVLSFISTLLVTRSWLRLDGARGSGLDHCHGRRIWAWDRRSLN
jgi:hypothetical protein